MRTNGIISPIYYLSNMYQMMKVLKPQASCKSASEVFSAYCLMVCVDEWRLNTENYFAC